MKKSNGSVFFVFTLLTVLTGCGDVSTSAPPTAILPLTSTATLSSTITVAPIPTNTVTPKPTNTATAIPTETPPLIPGIDEPVTLEEQGIKFQILGVDLEVGQEAGLTELILKYGPPFDITDAEWIAGNSQLTCGATTYAPRSMGFFVGEAGRIEHFRLIFDVPEDINLQECILQVTDVLEIPLASLPE